MKYMVMECHRAFAVVLDEDGRFLKVANMHYEVGETVTEVFVMKVQPKKKQHRWVFSLTAAAACVLLVISFFFQTGYAAYASVYLTINPEIRIDVDREDVVLGLEAMNEDGTALLSGYEYRKKKLNVVMDELVDRAIEMNYLQEGGTVSLRLDAQDETWIASHKESMGTDLERHLTDKLTVTVEITTKVPAQSTPVQTEDDDDDNESDNENDDSEPEDDEEPEQDEQEESDQEPEEEEDHNDKEPSEEDSEEKDNQTEEAPEDSEEESHEEDGEEEEDD